MLNRSQKRIMVDMCIKKTAKDRLFQTQLTIDEYKCINSPFSKVSPIR